MLIKDTSMPVYEIPTGKSVQKVETKLANMALIKEYFESSFSYDKNITFEIEGFNLMVYFAKIYFVTLDCKDDVENFYFTHLISAVRKLQVELTEVIETLCQDNINEVFSYIEDFSLEEQNKLLKIREEYKKGGHHHYESSKE